MDLNLKGKVIMVTGGSRGIGRSITMQLVEEGAIPFVVSRNEATMLELQKTIRDSGGEMGYFEAELTDPSLCEAAVRAMVQSYGRIDGLVNNAGVNDGVSLESGSHEEFIKSLEKNVVHYYKLAHDCLPYLKESKGAIVNIGSKTSFTGQGGTSGYAAANGGRAALTREWAVELLKYDIRVNAVIVAECYTPLYEKWISTFPDPEGKLKSITQNIPFQNRMTEGAEIANQVVFLLSDRSGHTTGQLIFVDGGYVHLDRALL